MSRRREEASSSESEPILGPKRVLLTVCIWSTAISVERPSHRTAGGLPFRDICPWLRMKSVDRVGGHLQDFGARFTATQKMYLGHPFRIWESWPGASLSDMDLEN